MVSFSAIAPPSPIPGFAPAQTWHWRDYPISYQTQGQGETAVILVHGFGASWGHWRKNIPDLAQQFRVYAIDLLGFGASAKPTPGGEITYTFETWSQQLADFCQEVVGTPAFWVGNSIGCIAVMQVACDRPDLALGVALINCSLRLLHDRHRAQQPWYRNIGTPILQSILGIRPIGHTFFNLVAKPKTVRNILLKAYGHPEAVTDELVNLLMAPARDPGAADVFIAFTQYSQGPLPDDLLAALSCPALILWGDQDPWEPIALGQKFAQYPAVQQFIPLEGAGHCPQDEVPDRVNALLIDWITQQAQSQT
jgi:pimeloyl-ACP methyl ester carboxylesterase